MATKGIPKANAPKNPKWNIFYVFAEFPGAKQATKEMKAAADKFVRDHNRISKKYESTGISDTASRDGIVRYIIQKMY